MQGEAKGCCGGGFGATIMDRPQLWSRTMADVYLVPGFRTPFVKAGGALAKHNAIELSVPVLQAMSARTAPDLVIWGQVIPDATVSNIARELIFEAMMSPNIPAFSTVMACSTSFIGTIEASGMVGRSDLHLALVGGVETMSHVSQGSRRGEFSPSQCRRSAGKR